MDTVTHCPLCSGRGQFFYKNKNSLFYKCDICCAIFLDRPFLPDIEDEKSRYHKHNNNANDPGYQKFVNPIVSNIVGDFSTRHKGLDFGAGSDSAVSKLLKERNFQIEQYDPLFHAFPELLEKKYDYIACCEVVEHFHHPNKEFAMLKKLLLPGGKLYCMTAVYNEETDFNTWYYKNDLTHVFFYHRKTFEWIKKEFGFFHLDMDNNLIILAVN